MKLNTNEIIIKVDYSSFESLESLLKLISAPNVTYKKLGADEYIITFQ